MPDIEDAMNELQDIVEVLESGQTPLGVSLEQFERAMKLLKSCHEQLDHASRRIEVLTRVSADGSFTTEPFDATATADRPSNKPSVPDSRPAAPQRPAAADSVSDDTIEIEEDGVDPATLF